MSRNKHRRTFKLNLYPQLDQWIALRDCRYFYDHPSENQFLRQSIAGEFNNPAIRFVLVRRGLPRVPLTIEETKRLEDPEFFRRVAGG